jgi:methionyl-tRNA synthetase
MPPSAQKFFLTTPIYYVNAHPHIGHAYTTIVADVLARRHRLLGDDTFFLTGTDEHGQKIERSAAAAGIPPQQFADKVSASFQQLWDRMGITYDDYIRTTEPRHKRGVQKLFRLLQDRGHIYLSTYTGQYCVSDEAYVDGPPGVRCPDCGRITETVSESNYYFRLSAFQQPVIDLIESGQMSIQPESRRNEVLSFLRSGLKDLSISRTSFHWGVPVTGDEAHVIYVWLDALANYMTAIGYGSDSPADREKFQRFWPANLHLVGKEIIRFHCVYWPAFLLAAGLPTPKAITAHGWLLFEESKMSKSRGNIVRTETILDGFGEHVYAKQFPESTKRERDLFATDVLRYFLLREIPFGQDGSFSFEAMLGRYDTDLASGYGNVVSRTLKQLQSGFESIFPDRIGVTRELRARRDNELQFTLEKCAELEVGTTRKASESRELFGNNGFNTGLERAWRAITDIDIFLAGQAPWRNPAGLSDREIGARRSLILTCAAESIRIITALLYPILPHATAKVWAQLGLGSIEEAAHRGELKDLQWGGLQPGTKLGPLAPIFPRADKGLAQIMADMEQNSTPQNLSGFTVQADAQTSTETEFAEAPLSSVSGDTPLAPEATDGPYPGVPAPSKLSNELTSAAAPAPLDPTHPAAGPRTSGIQEAHPIAQVAGSSSLTTSLHKTPSHSEAPTSGPFATQASIVPVNAQPANASPQIAIDDFAKVELRVAKILICERIPKADKLLRLEVDLGYERRQILSGIAEWYTPEDLLGRKIVVITNLAPRKMRGLESHGMLLAASTGENGKPALATFADADEVEVGARLK